MKTEYTRQMHLINAAQVWISRAIEHAAFGRSDKSEEAAREARQTILALEVSIIGDKNGDPEVID